MLRWLETFLAELGKLDQPGQPDITRRDSATLGAGFAAVTVGVLDHAEATSEQEISFKDLKPKLQRVLWQNPRRNTIKYYLQDDDNHLTVITFDNNGEEWKMVYSYWEGQTTITFSWITYVVASEDKGDLSTFLYDYTKNERKVTK